MDEGWLKGHAGYAATDDVRILRRLSFAGRDSGVTGGGDTKIAVVVDCETTGLQEDAALVELSLRRCRFDASGVITKLDRSYGWLEDPGRPLDPAICDLTGLSDEALRGARIADDLAIPLLRSAHIRIAFNAPFDRGFVERRFPVLAGLPWACAMREVDWRRRGFDGSGRSLGWLLAQCGYFNDRAHRAAGDVDATIAILEHRDIGGATALLELLETASRPTWRIAAVGAHFNVKDALKRRGYRWDPSEVVWWREVADGAREDEEAWLAVNVYGPEHMPRMDHPLVRKVTWETRHG